MLNQVMLIDDSESDLLYGRIMLERSGMVREVLTFESAAQALAHLRGPAGAQIDLVLLDINMPGMDGWDFLEAWCGTAPAMRPTPVVMLTSSPDPQDRARAGRFPCVRGYVIKPLTREAALQLSPPGGP